MILLAVLRCLDQRLLMDVTTRSSLPNTLSFERDQQSQLALKNTIFVGAAAGAAASGAGKLANQAQSEDVGEKDAQPATTEDDLAASAAATAGGAAAQTAPGSSKEKDTQKEVMQERIDLYSTAHDENELNLRRNTILGTVCGENFK